MNHSLVRQLCVALFALAGVAPASLAAEPPSTIVVFDGSGSMWGKLDGEKQTKLVLARDALKANIAKLKPDARFGLASFGHRRQADCTDVQVIVPPEAGAGERLSTVLDKHNPRGKGPLTTALKEAAKALGKGVGPRSLILIHDDPDNCQQDACAALGELQAFAPGVHISVVGLGLKSEDAQRLMCLTKPTGGKLFDAQNAGQIVSGIDEAVRLASFDGAAPEAIAVAVQSAPVPTAIATAPAAVPPVQPRAPLASSGSPALRLAALLTLGAMPHPHSVRWSVTPEAAGAMPAFTGSGQDVLVPLPSGDYIIEAQDGLVRATQRVTVKEIGHTSGDVVLTAGVMRLKLATGRDTTSAALTTITIFEAGSGAASARLLKPVGVLTGRDDTIALPAASYLVRLQRGPQVIERPLTITAGRTEDLDLALNTARLTLTLAATPNQAQQAAAEPAPLTLFTIFEDDPDVPKGRREVTRSVAPEPDFILAPGTYYVVARQGRVEARERVTLTAGEAVRKVLALLPARLKVSSKLALLQPANADTRGREVPSIGYRIDRLDVVPAESFTVNEAVATLYVPAGRYRIEARHGRVNARASRDVTVGPGETQDVVLEPKAGVAQFRLGAEAAATAADIFWEIRDEAGRPVWTTVQFRPSAILQAGRYTVAAETRDKRYQQNFEIKAGEQRTIEVAN